MALRLELHPAAIEEAGEAYQRYAQRSPAAADRFLAELDHAYQQILQRPEGWSRYLHGTRCYILRRYPFVVVFNKVAESVHVLAVAHARRRPGYWKQRL